MLIQRCCYILCISGNRFYPFRSRSFCSSSLLGVFPQILLARQGWSTSSLYMCLKVCTWVVVYDQLCTQTQCIYITYKASSFSTKHAKPNLEETYYTLLARLPRRCSNLSQGG